MSNPVVSKAGMFQFQLVDPGVSLLFSDELQSSVVVGSIPEEALGSVVLSVTDLRVFVLCRRIRQVLQRVPRVLLKVQIAGGPEQPVQRGVGLLLLWDAASRPGLHRLLSSIRVGCHMFHGPAEKV